MADPVPVPYVENQAALPEDAEVFVTDTTGQRATIRRGDLDEALRRGYRLETPEATIDAKMEAEYGDQPWQAGAEGVARGLTLGLSDVVFGQLDEEGLREKRKHNSTASFAGELGGNVALSLLLPGVGTAGKGVAATKGASAISRYTPALVRNTAEGALFGAGQGISTVALSKDPMSAEAALYEIGSSALLGGAVGGGLGVGGVVLSEAAQSARALAARHLKPTFADDLIASASAAAPDAELARIAAKAPRPNAKVAASLEAEAAAARKAAAEGVPAPGVTSVVPEAPPAPVRTPNEVADQFRKDYQRIDTAARQNYRQLEGLEKQGLTHSKGGYTLAEVRESAEALEAARRKMREHMPLHKERTYEVLEEGQKPPWSSGYAKGQGRSIWNGIGTDEEQFAAILKAAKNPQFREDVWQFEARLDDMQYKLGNKEYPTKLGVHEALYPGMAPPPPAVAPVSPAMRAEVESFAAKADRIEKVLSKETRSAADNAFLSETVTLAEKRGMTLGPKELDQLVADAGFPGLTAAELPADALTRLKADAYSRMAKAELAQIRATGASARKAAAAAKKEPKSALSDLIGDNMAERAATVAGGAIGSALGAGPWIGGFAGRALFGGPMKKIADAMAGRVGKGAEKLAAGVDSFLSGASKAARKAPSLTGAVLTSVSFATDKGEKETKGTPFQQRSRELSKAMAEPERTRMSIHEALAGVRAADPMLADQMEELAFQRMSFLEEKRPKNPGIGSLIGRRAEYRPSDSEEAKWARYIEAAENPGTIVDRLTDGTLTVEAVETMEALYPETYARIQADIVSRAGELQSELDWQQRLTLSTLFKVPADASLTPAAIMSMQANYAIEEPEQGAPSGANLGSVKAPEPTPAQRMSTR